MDFTDFIDFTDYFTSSILLYYTKGTMERTLWNRTPKTHGFDDLRLASPKNMFTVCRIQLTYFLAPARRISFKPSALKSCFIMWAPYVGKSQPNNLWINGLRLCAAWQSAKQNSQLLTFANQVNIPVIPAQAGIHQKDGWIPAFAGMTKASLFMRRSVKQNSAGFRRSLFLHNS